MQRRGTGVWHAEECWGGAGRALSASVQAERYLWSVTPCLMAWPAIILEPGPGSLIVGTTLGVSDLHNGCILLTSFSKVDCAFHCCRLV